MSEKFEYPPFDQAVQCWWKRAEDAPDLAEQLPELLQLLTWLLPDLPGPGASHQGLETLAAAAAQRARQLAAALTAAVPPPDTSSDGEPQGRLHLLSRLRRQKRQTQTASSAAAAGAAISELLLPDSGKLSQRVLTQQLADLSNLVFLLSREELYYPELLDAVLLLLSACNDLHMRQQGKARLATINPYTLTRFVGCLATLNHGLEPGDGSLGRWVRRLASGCHLLHLARLSWGLAVLDVRDAKAWAALRDSLRLRVSSKGLAKEYREELKAAGVDQVGGEGGSGGGAGGLAVWDEQPGLRG
eukprot:gene8810-8989_t